MAAAYTFRRASPAAARGTFVIRSTEGGGKWALGLPRISLAAARNSAAEARSFGGRKTLRPIDDRDALRARQRLEQARGVAWEGVSGRSIRG